MPRCLLVLLSLALLIAKAHAGTYCIRAYTTANGKESLPSNFVTRTVTDPATTVTVSWVNPSTYDDNSSLAAAAITQTRVAWGTCAGDVFTKLGEQKLSGAPTSTILSLDDPTPPTCGAAPPLQTKVATCTPPAVGNWTQTAGWTAADPPACWVPNTTWVPTESAAGVCATPPPPALTTADTKAYELRSATLPLAWVGLVRKGMPCGPETMTRNGVTYCRVALWRADGVPQALVVVWPQNALGVEFWVKASP